MTWYGTPGRWPPPGAIDSVGVRPESDVAATEWGASGQVNAAMRLAVGENWQVFPVDHVPNAIDTGFLSERHVT